MFKTLCYGEAMKYCYEDSGVDKNYKWLGGYVDNKFASKPAMVNVSRCIARIENAGDLDHLIVICKQYSAYEAFKMGLVNKVVPQEELEEATVKWCKIIQNKSTMALRMINEWLDATLMFKMPFKKFI